MVVFALSESPDRGKRTAAISRRRLDAGRVRLPSFRASGGVNLAVVLGTCRARL
jgi:hypothetical protein